MRFTLLQHNPAPPSDLPAEAITEMMAAFDAYATQLDQAGVLIAAEALHPAAQAVTVTTQGGAEQLTDGPVDSTSDAPVTMVFIIDVPTRDQAIRYAAANPGATYGAVEVRQAATSFVNGSWTR